jgi:hypothetical protein
MRSTTFLLRTVSSLALAGVVLCGPLPATAGETESRTLFVSGRELRTAGKCDEAIVMFRRALETYPEGLGSLRNIAECEAELGRFASARRSYWDLRLAALQSTTSKYEGWDKEAEAEHAKLASQVAKVTVTFKGDRPEGLVIRFNGKPFDPRLVGVEIEQDNGPLEVSVSFGAGPPMTKTVQVVTSGRHLIEFDLAELPRPSPQPTPPPGGQTSDGGLTPMQVGGIVALGVGGAALIGTVVTTIMRQSALGTIEDNCEDLGDDNWRCPSSFEGDRSQGETASVLWNVFTATAIVGAGVGVTLLVVGGNDDAETGAAPPSPRASVSVSPLAGGAFLGVKGSL